MILIVEMSARRSGAGIERATGDMVRLAEQPDPAVASGEGRAPSRADALALKERSRLACAHAGLRSSAPCVWRDGSCGRTHPAGAQIRCVIRVIGSMVGCVSGSLRVECMRI